MDCEDLMLSKMYAIILISVVILSLLPQLHASMLEVAVKPEGIEVNYNVLITQNFTSLRSENTVLDEATLKGAAATLEEGIRALSPKAQIQDLKMEIMTKSNSLNLLLSFKILGLADKQGNLIRVDCSWKSFKVSTDLVAGDIRFNRFGESYIRPTIEPYLNSSSFRMWVNGTRQVLPSWGANYAGNITLIDFVGYSRPLEFWNSSFFIENKTTSWHLKPVALLNMTVTYRAENVSQRFYAIIENEMRVNVPSLAKAEDNVIIINQGQKNYEIVFSLIIIVTLVFSIVFYVRERKARKRVLKKKR